MFVIFLLFSCGFLLAQDRPSNALETAALPAQSIGPNDLVSISVYNSPEFTRTVRVGPDGLIRLPMLKKAIKAEGLFPSDLERAVAAALSSEQLVVDPFVTVGIAEYHSRPISVAGAVKAPLTFQAAGPVTLLEAITRAGGLTAEAGPDIVVSRQGSDKSGTPLQRIPVKGLFDIADPMLNLSLTGGEEIRVPEIGKVFVVGNVKKPGAYPLQSGSETSILKVIALAEGLLPFAAKEAYVYRREGGNGGKNEIPVELKKILDRKIPDTALLANDVLYVPDNNTKRLGTAALERLLMFGSTAGATALIYGQAR